MEEQFNKEVKQGVRFAADAARIASQRRVQYLWQLTVAQAR